MATQPTRSQLKKQFLSGQITADSFHDQLQHTLRYRGYHNLPGQNPKWSGPFHTDKQDAEDDNAPWFDLGHKVGIYTEQG
jgi:hypothetical protein